MKRAVLTLLIATLLGLPTACGDSGGVTVDEPDSLVQDASPEDGTATPADVDLDAVAAADTGPDAAGRPDPTPDPLVDLVDMFVGTGAELINFGALFPGAATPFGMVKLSPDTEGTIAADFGVLHAGGYYYDDTEVMGFSHIHLAGTGVADYGNLLVVPAIGDPEQLVTATDVPNLPLDHDLEYAEPGYYRLQSADPAVTAELTATARTGLHRYTFPETTDALVVVDVTHVLGKGEVADSSVTLDPATGELSGFVHNVGEFSSRFDGFELFFVIAPDPPPASWGVFDGDGYHAAQTSAGGIRSGAVLRYESSPEAPITLRVGISFVDVAGARANLEAEAAGEDFDSVRAAARATWEEALAVVEVEGGTDTRRRLLYTSLYHAQLMPTLLTDVDGRYRGLDKEVHTAEGYTYYTDFSMWDTYRTFHPLASLVWPQHQRNFLRSLATMAQEGGSMPVWPLAIGYTGSMIGTSADIVFGDAVDKGYTDFDVETAYQAMRKLAMEPAPPGKPGRDELEICLEVGWCPADQSGGSVSKTLEYAADDACLATLAGHLGHADDAAMFTERAGRWTALWDDSKGFLAPRNTDGSFAWYDPYTRTSAYIEGTPWHYLFMVPHDVPSLVDLMGGPPGFLDRLTTFMQTGRDEFSMLIPSAFYWHGNEPDIVAPWLFGFGGRPDLTRWWTTWAADTAYLLKPGGLAGNDDGGTLSAWYVFAAIGIYPLPCTGQYALSTPLFDRVIVHMPGGDLDVRAGDDPDGVPTLDGADHDDPLLDHDAIADGALLVLPPAPPTP